MFRPTSKPRAVREHSLTACPTCGEHEPTTQWAIINKLKPCTHEPYKTTMTQASKYEYTNIPVH